MTYLADSVFLIELFRKRPEAMEKARSLVGADIKTTTITAAELYEGAFRAKQTSRHLLQLDEFWQRFDPIPFQLKHAKEFGRLKSLHNQIPINDLLIASIALSEKHILLTKNTNEFVTLGVQTEDWL